MLVKNLPTQWQEAEKENRIKDQLIKKLRNSEGELRRKIDGCWRRDTEKKVVDKKPPDPEKTLGGKPTPKLEPLGLLLLGFFAETVK